MNLLMAVIALLFGVLILADQRNRVSWHHGFPELPIQELGGAMNRLYEDPELRLRMGQACRERVLHDFSWTEFAKRMNDPCLEIASASDGASS